MKLKRLPAMLIAAAMTVGAVNVGFAEEKAENTNIEAMSTKYTTTYKVDGGCIYFNETTGTITGVDPRIESAIIPDTINGVKVTAIGDNAFICSSKLKIVTIPNSVTSIGNSAFEGCSFESITIPDSVTFIGISAFASSKLQNIYVSENNNYYTSINGILFNKDKTIICAYPPKKAESSYTIPNTVIKIAECAFYSCTDLTSITIPDSVTSIERRAFKNCGLLSITLPNSITYINDEAFYECKNLTTVTIADSVTSIGDGVFAWCENLQSIYVLENNNYYTSEDGVLFNKDKTTIYAYPPKKVGNSYIIPNTVTTISKYAFCGCTDLTNITIPNSVTSIKRYAFKKTGLLSVTLPNSITCIDIETFYECQNLTTVTIPNSVTTIEIYAFTKCNNLTSLTIPASVHSLGSSSFENSGLKEVYCYKGSNADNINFYPNGVKLIYIDSDQTESTTENPTEPTTETPSPEPATTFTYGDANGDGIITAADAAMILEKSLNLDFITEIERNTTDYKKYLDVNRDDKIDANDAAIVLQKSLNFDFEMACEK